LTFYREDEAEVRIERVMHSARDITGDALTFGECSLPLALHGKNKNKKKP
jgi:hypothetical protein